MDYQTSIPCPAGWLRLRSDGQSLTALAFSAESGQSRDPLPLFSLAENWLRIYWQGRDPGPLLFPLAPGGTAFQQAVWEAIRHIPYGETRTYGELAAALGNPGAARAVGQAAGRNPIAILIPCHRVLGAGNRLTGYAWGTEIKKQLLSLEGQKLP